MKKIVMLFSIFLVTVSTMELRAQEGGIDGRSYLLLAQAKAVTIPGFVEYLDLDAKVIGVEGKMYNFDERTVITAKGQSKTIEDISLGKFVIVTVRDNFVVALTLIPQGQGF
jgi:hypothetical protein